MKDKDGMWNTVEGIKGRSVIRSKRQLYRKEIWEATDPLEKKIHLGKAQKQGIPLVHWNHGLKLLLEGNRGLGIIRGGHESPKTESGFTIPKFICRTRPNFGSLEFGICF